MGEYRRQWKVLHHTNQLPSATKYYHTQQQLTTHPLPQSNQTHKDHTNMIGAGLRAAARPTMLRSSQMFRRQASTKPYLPKSMLGEWN
jgi:hypothetical protein